MFKNEFTKKNYLYRDDREGFPLHHVNPKKFNCLYSTALGNVKIV